ncbi:MAG: YebC/PmpR family DNA-binding transcriptional regulator, partial [Candidatus Taylorbacteria bacterium]|nr:YebC/PmpR family DNA-binding transcriptional regulator [Candidatus Taylorbacteria bacterium]
HNRWKQIKERKGKTDSQKSKAFSRYAKLITIEAKKSGGNKDVPGLKAVIERARKENMPNDNIERAIKKSKEAGAAMEYIVYEAYGPGGVAIIIETLTDNRNKAAQEVKIALGKHDIELASPGSAMWTFKKENNTLTPTTHVTLSDLDLAALEKIVDELENCDEVQEVTTNAE